MELRPVYKQTEVGVIPEDWAAKKFGEVASYIGSGKSKTKSANGTYPVYGSTGVIGYNETSDYAGDAILVARVGANAGKLNVVSDEYGVTDNTIIVRLSDSFFLPFFFYQLEKKRLNTLIFGSGQPLITGTQLKELSVSVPPLPEQQAIAGALSDVATLIRGLDQLIAKKRDLKQAAMQQLLTGKQRLPGFSGEWEVKRFGDVLKVRHGKNQHSVAANDGQYPILATGGEIGRTNEYLYDKPSVLIGRKGTIDSPQYVDSPFWTIDTLFFTEINNSSVPKFIFYKFNTINWRSYNEASGVPSLNASTIEGIEFSCPSFEEQTAIASVLSDMDAEITALEQRRDKTRDLKQGMMQELLTGRIRLV